MTTLARPPAANADHRRGRRSRPRALAGFQEVPAQRGHLYFLADPNAEPPTSSTGVFRPRIARPSSLCVASVPAEFSLAKGRYVRKKNFQLPKLAWPKENARRLFRLVSAPSILSSAVNATKQDATIPAATSAHSPSEIRLAVPTIEEEMVSSDGAVRSRERGNSLASSTMHSRSRPVFTDSIRTMSTQSGGSDSSVQILEHEKPIASGNGISVYVTLAEPCLYLQGFDGHDASSRTTMLRGQLHIRVTKSAKLKKLWLKFSGRSETHWPEGIPPTRKEHDDHASIMNHVWAFFDAQFPNAEHSFGADHVQLVKQPSVNTKEIGVTKLNSSTHDLFQRSGQPNLCPPSSRDAKRLSLQLSQSRSFGKGETPTGGPTVAQKGYKLFHPGDYVYNFEHPIDSRLPESIDVELGSVKYELEAFVERAGAFRPNLVGSKELTLIRAPSEGSLEQVEPIAISRNWEDQLHYDIVISGKSFPLGSQIPIAFKLTPLAKVQCHRIKVYVTENTQIWTANRRVHRLEPTKKIQLFEKRADNKSTSAYAGSSMRVTAGGGIPYDQREAAAGGSEDVDHDRTNLLGDLTNDFGIGPTEMELNVQLPSCHQQKDKDKSQRLHFDTTYTNIQVNHWIKIVMRLSKPNEDDPTKRRHFEISIDSPFHILSCRATQANTSLPAYVPAGRDSSPGDQYECGCPGAAVRRRNSPATLNPITNLQPSTSEINLDQLPPPPMRSLTNDSGGLTLPPAAHVAGSNAGTSTPRPMHLLRHPSFNPPAFDDDLPPPPLITPPPDYGSIVSGEPGSGLADYFSRLADEMGDDDDSDGESRTAGRVNVPLTPGGRINRSMDARRDWLPLGSFGNPA